MYLEFEPGKKYASNGAEISDSIDSFRDAGYLLTDNDLIVDIDCLDRHQIEKMIVTFNIKTQIVWTSRGVHLYYKKSESFTRGANKICALGFPIELKHVKNTKAITIKQNGVLREIENHGVREDFPKIFSMNKRFDNLLGTDSEEGRNTSLFKLRNQLANCDGWQNILRYVNNEVFATPLEESEFQSITRDMVIEAEKDNEPMIAELMMNKYKMVKYSSRIYYRYDGKYVSDDEQLIRLIFDQVGSQKTRYVDEIRKQIEYRCQIVDDEKVFDIKFNNGILRDGEFIEIDSEDFTPYVIDIDYVPDAEPVEIVDHYIDHLTQSDPCYRQMIFEILGHCLIVDPEKKRQLAKFFIFIGGGSNGKGTLLQIIKKILGRDNCTALSIKNLSDERYLVSMKGKLANLGDDIQDTPIDGEQMEQLKKISTCDTAETRELYKQSSTTTMTASLIFTSNHMLKSFEKGDAYKRRVMWLPMYTKVEEGKKDGKFITKITTKQALEYWVAQIVKGYMRLYDNNIFTESKLVTDYNAFYHRENNNTQMFVEEYGIDEILGMKSPDLYEAYEVWSEDNGYKPSSNRMLKETLSAVLGVELKPKSINGKTQRVYVKIEDSDKTTPGIVD